MKFVCIRVISNPLFVVVVPPHLIQQWAVLPPPISALALCGWRPGSGASVGISGVERIGVLLSPHTRRTGILAVRWWCRRWGESYCAAELEVVSLQGEKLLGERWWLRVPGASVRFSDLCHAVYECPALPYVRQ